MALKSSCSELNVSAGLHQFALSTPDDIAVVDGALQRTFGELDDRANRLAAVLIAAGLQTGDRVGVLLGNRAEYIEVIAGVARAGLVIVPLNPKGTATDVDFICAHSGTRALIVADRFADLATDAASAQRVGAVLSLDGGSLGEEYEAALAQADPLHAPVPVDERSPFCVAYTSGTTGQPKGVLLSHRSRCLTFYAAAIEWGLGPRRRSVAVAPMYLGAGLTFGYGAVATGGQVCILAEFTAGELLSTIESHRAQSVFLVPTHAQRIRDLPPGEIERRDLSSLDTVFFNAAALPPDLKRWVIKMLPGVGVHELYGSTEAGIMANLRPAQAARKIGSVGTPWFLTEIQLLDSDGRPVPAGTPGLLYSRSPYLMNGYLDDDEATAACTTADGFFTSGDIAIADEDGYLAIVDRVKDVIISGGVNIYPREIEETLLAHAGVREVAVIGVPDRVWGERIVACIVPHERADPTDEELAQHCRAQLAGFKVPRDWVRLEDLPRNSAQKVLKRVLRRTLAADATDATESVAAAESVATPDSSRPNS